MKKWKVTKGRSYQFKDAPEWCTQISSDKTGVLRYYEEAFGILGKRFQKIGITSPCRKNDLETCNFGLTVIAERELVRHIRRAKGPKENKMTVNKVVVTYLNGKSYTIKNIVRVDLLGDKFRVLKKFNTKDAVLEFDGVEITSKEVFCIKIVGLNAVYTIKRDNTLWDVFELSSAKGDFIITNNFSLVNF